MKMEVACKVRAVFHLWQTAHLLQNAYPYCNYLTVSVVCLIASSPLECVAQAGVRVHLVSWISAAGCSVKAPHIFNN